jgi:hypothetical protein
MIQGAAIPVDHPLPCRFGLRLIGVERVVDDDQIGAAPFAAELHRQFRMVIDSQWYAKLFPHTISAKETGLELVTTEAAADMRPRSAEL